MTYIDTCASCLGLGVRVHRPTRSRFSAAIFSPDPTLEAEKEPLTKEPPPFGTQATIIAFGVVSAPSAADGQSPSPCGRPQPMYAYNTNRRRRRRSREDKTASPAPPENAQPSTFESAIIEWADGVLNDLEVEWGRRKKHVRQQGRRTRGRINSHEHDDHSAVPAAGSTHSQSQSMKTNPAVKHAPKRADSAHAVAGSHTGSASVLMPEEPMQVGSALAALDLNAQQRSPESFLTKLRRAEQMPAKPRDDQPAFVIANPPDGLIP